MLNSSMLSVVAGSLAMPYLYNLHRRKNIRRYLRNHATQTEVLLWQRLRRHQVLNAKFRRQAGIRNYTVDFYCPELKFAIEIDGSPHAMVARRQADAYRQQQLEAWGIQVLRFSANQVLDEIDQVIERISGCIKILRLQSAGLNQTSPPLTPPDGQEGN